MNVVGSRPVLKPIISRLGFDGSGAVVAALKYFEGTASLMVLKRTVCACAPAAVRSIATMARATRGWRMSELGCVIIRLSFRLSTAGRRHPRSRTGATRRITEMLECASIAAIGVRRTVIDPPRRRGKKGFPDRKSPGGRVEGFRS